MSFVILILFCVRLSGDWIKHSFITKFNFIKSSAYQDYALILAGDITGVTQDGLNIDHTHAVVKRIGFTQIPLVCVMARYAAEALRYADMLSDDGDSNHVLYSMAVLVKQGTWSQIASLVLIMIIVLLILKALLSYVVDRWSRSIILYGDSETQEVAPRNNGVQRRQAV